VRLVTRELPQVIYLHYPPTAGERLPWKPINPRRLATTSLRHPQPLKQSDTKTSNYQIFQHLSLQQLTH